MFWLILLNGSGVPGFDFPKKCVRLSLYVALLLPLALFASSCGEKSNENSDDFWIDTEDTAYVAENFVQMDCSGNISFDDLEEQIRRQMGILEGAITLEDTRVVKSLSLRLVENLRSLQCFENLEDLEIDNGSNYSDLFFHGGVHSCAPIEKLTKLKSLSIRRNTWGAPMYGYRPISELDLSQLPQLEAVDFSGSVLSDFSMFTGITSLRSVNVAKTGIAGSLAPLWGLPQLESLDLSECNGVDLTSLQNLNGLKTLYLRHFCDGNGDDCVPNVFGNLKGMTQLRELDLSQNNLATIDPLLSLPSLTKLVLTDNGLTDVSPLQNIPGLETLDLSRNRLTSMGGLKSLAFLSVLDLRNNAVTGIDGIEALPSISELYLDDNRITSVAPIAADTGFGDGDTVSLYNNAIHCEDLQVQLDLLAITERGGTVASDCYLSTFCNGGRMVSTADGYACEACPSGRTGEHCEILPACIAPILFGDAKVESVVRVALNKLSGDITDADMAGLTFLTISGEPIWGTEMDSMGYLSEGVVDFVRIEDLTGLQCATNLQTLSLTGMGSPDLSVLAYMPHLTNLSLDNLLSLEVADLEMAMESGAFNLLEQLRISHANLFDLNWLTPLPRLKYLDFGDNDIRDLSPLKKLNSGTYVTLSGNPATCDCFNQPAFCKPTLVSICRELKDQGLIVN